MLILARKHPLKRILLVLVAVIMAGNVCAALAPNFWTLMAARFVSGLPHGAYFGVGSIAAEKLADKGKDSEAVSIMIAGMTIANLLGVPLGTALSSMLSWRVTFLLVGCWGMIVLYYIWRWIPPVENLPDTGFGAVPLPAITGPVAAHFRHDARQRRRILLVQLRQSDVSARFGIFPRQADPADDTGRFRYGRGEPDRRPSVRPVPPGRVAAVSQGSIFVILLLLFFTAHTAWLGALLMCLCTAGLFAVSSPQQILLIRYSKGGEMLGAGSVQVAFNLGNAIRSLLRRIAAGCGLGYQYPALVGAPFALAGFVLLTVFHRKYERSR